MTRPYSVDLRERVLSAVHKGAGIRGAAAQFGVSPGFVSKLGTRYRRTGDVRPDAQGGDHRSDGIEAHAAWLLSRVEDIPDITLVELCADLDDRGFRTVPSTVWRFLDRHDLTFKKKTAHASEQERPDVKEARQDWRAHPRHISARRMCKLPQEFRVCFRMIRSCSSST